MKRIILCITLLFATLFVATARAQESTAQRSGTRMVQRIEARLGVTPQQIVEVKLILQQEKPTLQSIHVQLAAEHAELDKLTTFNEAQTEAIVAKYASVNNEQLIEREKLRCELYAILTPAQQQKLEQLRAQFGAGVDDQLQTLGDNL